MKRIEQCLKKCGDPELGEILRVAACGALAAGAVLRELYDKPHQVTHKGSIDLVTEADVAAEKKVLAILDGYSAQIAVLAEESQSVYAGAPTGPVWIIDPLDGTTNFAHGFPSFAVSIAYAVGAESRVGVIYAPMSDELFCAVQGAGAWLNGKQIKVSAVGELKGSLLATGFPYAIEQEVDGVVAILKRFLTRSQGIRRAGAAAMDLAYLACGRLDGFWEINLKPWDTAAGILLVTEAGGRLTDFAGGPYSPYKSELLASNGKLHEEMVDGLREFSRV
ncbi:MAG: inositol monophosphatase [Desulfobulbaceae bacterium]|nr:inositol monophosphatase [Desulfobulbaceae bacterium]